MDKIIDEKNVLAFMLEYAVTQSKLASYANIQRKTLYNFLNCKHKPSLYVQSCLYRAMKKIRKEHKKTAVISMTTANPTC